MYKHVHTRLNDVCSLNNVDVCTIVYTMSVSVYNCIYHVCQPLYTSIVHTLYIHGSDMSVHVYARWSGFQMQVQET